MPPPWPRPLPRAQPSPAPPAPSTSRKEWPISVCSGSVRRSCGGRERLQRGVGGERGGKRLDEMLEVRQKEVAVAKRLHLLDRLVSGPVVKRDAVERDHDSGSIGAAVAVHKDRLIRIVAQQSEKRDDLLVRGFALGVGERQSFRDCDTLVKPWSLRLPA